MLGGNNGQWVNTELEKWIWWVQMASRTGYLKCHALEIFDTIYCPKVGVIFCIIPDDDRNGTDVIIGTDDIEMTSLVTTLKKHLYMH
jgi:hypothetical protein